MKIKFESIGLTAKGYTLEGQQLKDGDVIEVTWPDGTKIMHQCSVDVKSLNTEYPDYEHHTTIKVLFHGATLDVVPVGLEAKLRKRK